VTPPGSSADRSAVVIAAVLAGVTGVVDAVGFTRMFSVFPANQSGNLVVLGIALGDGTWGEVWRPALAMVVFVVGVAVGLRLGDRLPAARRATTLLAIETGVLVALAAGAGDLAGRTAPYGGGREVGLLVLAAFAMGLQTDVIRRAARVPVSTTYQTGTLVRLGGALAGEPARADASRAWVVLTVLVVAYVGGAAGGTGLLDAWGHGLWFAAAVTGVVAVASARYVGSTPDA
jgi:uncharacterized membrane protein YoaK (UPF0700 family)